MKTRQIFTYSIISAFFICAIGASTQGYMLNDFIEIYSIQSARQGLVGTFFSVGQIAALFLVFILTGRIKKPTFIILALAAASCIFCLLSLIPPFFLLLILYSLFGIMFAINNTISSSLVADINNKKDIPKYMCMLHGVFGLGGLLAPLIFLVLNKSGVKWNSVLLYLSILFLLFSVIYYIITKKASKSVNLEYAEKVKIKCKDIFYVISDKKGAMLILSAFFYGAHQSVFIVWIYRYVSIFLDSESLGALALSLFWTGMAISRLLISRINIKPKNYIKYGNIFAALIIVIGIISNTAIVMTICTFLAGISAGPTVPLLMAKGCDMYQEKTVLATNVVLISIYFAQMVTPVIVAAVNNSITNQIGMLLAAVFSIICAVTSSRLFVIHNK